MRKGLVIQGPLTSTGRHGGNWYKSASEVMDEDVVTHECLRDIAQIVEAAGGYFDAGIVVATWQGQVAADIPGAHRLDLALPPVPKQDARWHESVASNNKLRQFVSSLAGTELLVDNGAELIVKIRTDIRIDVVAFAEYALRVCEHDSNAIVVPSLPLDRGHSTRYRIDDFYFAGRAETMHRFFYSQTWSGQACFAKSVHVDMPLRYAFALDHEMSLGKPQVSKIDAKYFIADGSPVSPSSRRVLRRVIEKHFVAGPRNVFEGLVWRGHQWANTDLTNRLFDARWNNAENLHSSRKWWHRPLDALLADYGRAASIYSVATNHSAWRLRLIEKTLRPLQYLVFRAVHVLRRTFSRFTISW